MGLKHGCIAGFFANFFTHSLKSANEISNILASSILTMKGKK